MLSHRWRASVPVVAAVAVVAALSLLTVTVMSSIGGGDDERAFVDVDGDGSTTTTEASRRVPPRPTTTTTTPDPEVLGETTEREPDAVDPTVTTVPGPPAPAPAPAPPAPAPTAPPTTSAPAPTAPPTTVCRNSTDPSCGDFSWDPQPGEYEVEVYPVSTPPTAAAGEPVTFAIDYIDPGGPDAGGACVNWSAPGASTNISSCEVIADDCARTGPHDPPAPSRELIRVEQTFTFEEPGTYEVILAGNIGTHLADGCPSPYRNDIDVPSWTIEVS